MTQWQLSYTDRYQDISDIFLDKDIGKNMIFQLNATTRVFQSVSFEVYCHLITYIKRYVIAMKRTVKEYCKIRAHVYVTYQCGHFNLSARDH